MEGRSDIQCRYQYFKLTESMEVRYGVGQVWLQKSEWTREEDKHLKAQVKVFGKDWKKVACFGRATGSYRSALQCKRRYWVSEELRLMFERWAEIKWRLSLIVNSLLLPIWLRKYIINIHESMSTSAPVTILCNGGLLSENRGPEGSEGTDGEFVLSWWEPRAHS